MNWTDPSVQAALIQAIGGLVAATIAAISAAIIGKQFADRKRLQERLNAAQKDIAFMLAVEEEHCKLHVLRTNESFKQRVRRMVYDRGLYWTGRFTPGRVKDQALIADQ